MIPSGENVLSLKHEHLTTISCREGVHMGHVPSGDTLSVQHSTNAHLTGEDVRSLRHEHLSTIPSKEAVHVGHVPSGDLISGHHPTNANPSGASEILPRNTSTNKN